MDPDWDSTADSVPTTDPNPFFLDFKNEKKNFLFCLITFPQALDLKSKKFNFLLQYCVKFLFCRHYFSALNILIRMRKDPDPEPYLCLLDPD
jgi:hypothetical protein